MLESYKKLIKAQSWHYSQGGSDWRDGLFLGNGNIGTLAYAPSHLEWVFNKVDVFDPSVEEDMAGRITPYNKIIDHIKTQKHKNSFFLREKESAAMQRAPLRNTLSAAMLRLRFWPGIGWAAPPAPQTSQDLSLYDGILTERMSSHGFHPTAEMFAVRSTGAFVMRVTEPDAPRRPHFLEFLRPPADFLQEPLWLCHDDTFVFTQQLPDYDFSYIAAMKIVPRNGGTAAVLQKTSGNYAVISQQGDFDCYISFKTSLETEHPLGAALCELAELSAAGYDSLRTSHLEWWHNYWDNGYIDFGSCKDFQKYYTFALYEIASTYGQTPMPGLNGLTYGPVNEQMPGVSTQGYVHDQNVQIPAMPFFPTNRTDLVKVIADTYIYIIEDLKKYTRKIFNVPGIFLPLNMNQLGCEYPVRHYRCTFCGSAYTGLILAQAWKYSRDVELLSDYLYPLLREFAIFYSSLLEKDDNGTYHTLWSVPPEIFTFTRDEGAVVSMFKVILETVLETAPLLNKDKAWCKKWQDILDHYPEIPQTPDGALWAGLDVPFDHYFFGGHILYGYFPSGAINDDEVARKTLDLIEKHSVERSFADLPGQWHPNHDWSMFLQTATRLFCGDYARGWRDTERFLELFGKENGLFSHDPIMIADPAVSEANEKAHKHLLRTGRKWIDGTVLAADNPEIPYSVTVTPNKNAKRLAPAVLEGASAFCYLATAAILQSRGGIIKVFPAVPEDFTGSFDRLLAEGAFEVSAKMRKGKVLQVKIKSLQGGVCRLLDPFDNSGKILEIELRKNQVAQWRANATS